MSDVDFDLDRLPYEIRRAVESRGVMIEQLDPGLNVVPHDEYLEVVDCHGTSVGEIPLYRLASIDVDTIPAVLAELADHLPTHLRDQVAAALRDGAPTIRDFTDGEHVAIDVGPIKVALIHRCHLVPSWTEDDTGDDGTDYHYPQSAL
jgi:hypothetical protein